jgi:sugar lactone lactonase YvrE
MDKKKINAGMFLLLSLTLLISCSKNNELNNQIIQENLSVQNKKPVPENRSLNTGSTVSASVSVFVPNIAFPRGLKFGPDGYLYVALAGFGGKDSTIGKCTQVIPPVGPYKGGNTSKIIKINSKGVVSTVAENLPSDVNALGFTSGVSDVEFVEDKLYALLVAGCSHGNANVPSSVLKVNRKTGKWSVFADLSTYFANNPVAAPNTDDFEPDGTPYSLINVRGTLFTIEPNHGELLKISKSGNVSRVIDFSAHFGHIVPTVVVFHDGNFFVGNLRTFPLVAGSSDIYKVSPDGGVEVFATGFTGVLGVAFDKHDRLYVLETSAGGGPTPNTGRVVRVNSDNSRDIIVDKLFFPTGMTFGPDGALYISNTGFGPPTGQILKVVFKDEGDQKDQNRHDNER